MTHLRLLVGGENIYLILMYSKLYFRKVAIAQSTYYMSLVYGKF